MKYLAIPSKIILKFLNLIRDHSMSSRLILKSYLLQNLYIMIQRYVTARYSKWLGATVMAV